MTLEELELQIKFTGTKNKKERQNIYNLLIDNLIDENKITFEQGNILKSDGYEKHMENMEEIQYNQKIIEILDYGFITK